ncbi:MAG: hypothetical protein Q9187_005262 [Circinaria calcarea]
MSYFLPSFFQKRILRYALSRLELLETDALDLEKLDIAWGKRSTVELRDVGLKLKLPDQLRLTKAKIVLLRVTVPADLYSSGILVEVEGVEGQVDVISEVGETTKESRAKGGRRGGIAKGTKANQPRSSQSLVHDPGGYLKETSLNAGDADDRHGPHIPSTVDLAKSFLQTEPDQEKAELRADIAKSQHVQQPQIIDDSDEAIETGIGIGFSLPGFLADFLKGVGDRLHVQVRGIQFDIDLKIEVPSQNPTSGFNSAVIEPITLRLSVEHVLIDGVTGTETNLPSPEPKEDQGPTNRNKSSQHTPLRRIAFGKVQGTIISDASLFASLSQLSGPPSPVVNHSSAFSDKCRKSELNAFTSKPTSSCSSTSLKDSHSITVLHSTTERPENAINLEASIATSDGERFADAGVDDDIGYAASSSEGSMQNSALSDTKLEIFEDERASDCAGIEEGINEGNSKGSGSLPRTSRRAHREQYGRGAYPKLSRYSSSSSDNIRQASKFQHHETQQDAQREMFGSTSSLEELSATSRSVASKSLDNLEQSRDNIVSSRERDPHVTALSVVASESPSPPTEDLTQSRIFDHEEAESLYMSAFSHTSSLRHGRQTSPDIEASFSSNEDESTDRPRSEHASDGGSQSTVYGNHTTPEESARYPGFLADTGSDYMEPSQLNSRQSSSSIQVHSSLEDSGPINIRPKENVFEKSPISSPRSGSLSPMMKHILSIDSIILDLPQNNKTLEPLHPGNGPLTHAAASESDIPEVPGAFSAFDNSAPGHSVDFGDNHNQQTRPRPISQTVETDITALGPTCAQVGQVTLVSDLGLTRLVIMIGQQLPKIFSKESTLSQTYEASNMPPNRIFAHLDRFTWNFVDALRGFVDTSSQQGDEPSADAIQTTESEILLTVIVNVLEVSHNITQSISRTELSVGSFKLGYPSDDIISFDPTLKMRESTHDVLLPSGREMEIVISQSSESLDVKVTALPLHVTLDLARLDETFSWFGGLSSVLGVGSSMISTATVLETKQRGSHNAIRPRGVRFAPPGGGEPTEYPAKSAHHKITTRVGGLLFDLQGKQSCLRFESTAMKLVSRVEGVGLTIGKFRFSGPYLREPTGDPTISMQSRNIRIEYLSNPKEVDLARLLALLSPSREKGDCDDDVMLDPLLRQRRQGGVVRITVETVQGGISDLKEFDQFSILAEELTKLSTVTKYLPEDDRPGILTLGLVRDLHFDVHVNSNFQTAKVSSQNIELAHVTFPSLTLLGIKSIQVQRRPGEELVGEALAFGTEEPEERYPMIRLRMIGDELEPTIKVKLWNIRLEYHLSTIQAILGRSEDGADESMTSSDITATGQSPLPKLTSQTSSSSGKSSTEPKTLRYDISVRDSIIGLNPRNSSSRGLCVLTNTKVSGIVPRSDEADISGILEVRKASVMVIDNISNAVTIYDAPKTNERGDPRSQLQTLAEMGYVSVTEISAAKIILSMTSAGKGGTRSIDVEIRDELFVLETCADSTQTLLGILSGLQPPKPPDQKLKYRTEVNKTELVSVQDMLASLSGEAFAVPATSYDGGKDFPLEGEDGDMVDDELPQDLEYAGSFYDPDSPSAAEELAQSIFEEDLSSLAIPRATRKIGDKKLLESFKEQYEVDPDSETLDFRDDHFGNSSTVGGTAHRWNSERNTYDLTNDFKIRGSPLRLRIRDVHIIWNLFDGYDWQHTRDAISQAVADVENKAAERLTRKSSELEEEDESVIGDFLFNSIYIGIPANRDPRDLTQQVNRQVNRNIDDLASETGSYATSTTATASPSRQGSVPRTKRKKLRLARSKHHKMTFELKGISVDMIEFPAGSGEIQSSVDIRVQHLDIFDHVPTSTWKKFATYMHDAGERESGTSMVHIEILNIKPVPELAASEISLKATVLPLRLHVDQDALDFLTRFFEFKDDSAPTNISKPDVPFLQRVEVNSIQVKLDFKPKRVDYAGIRSGHTTEFMNFFILDQADMVLRHVIIYGVSGFDKLGKTLNDIWMPDIKRNQLPGILSGLAPVRSLVNVGGGVRDLVVVPMREYRKDGRVMRSISKGALSFAKTTTTELAKLGAKLALGTQTVLQNAEDFLIPPVSSQRLENWESAETDEEEKKVISLYADQPIGVVQGLRGAYKSLERDLLTARDAIVAMPGEVMESGSAGGAARAVLRGAPTVILRPALGVSKAVGQTLLGAANTLDKGERRRNEDVSFFFQVLCLRMMRGILANE